MWRVFPPGSCLFILVLRLPLQCVGNCECLPERDMPNDFITIHFSCIQYGIHKPGTYTTEQALFEEMYKHGRSCTRHYYLAEWYARFKRATGGLPGKYTGPEVPMWDAAHDEVVLANRKREHRPA
jgi:hypothetical protein